MFTLNCRGRLLVVDKPILMGILNATPDSFYEGSRFPETEAILKKAEQMLEEGATILDIGGQSTRPGSSRLEEDEELGRVIEPIRLIAEKFPDAFISIDTYSARVANEAVQAGAHIVNDISGGKMDNRMWETVIPLRVPYILTHMQGTPETMHQDPRYGNVTLEVQDFLIRELDALRKAGQHDVIIDPGFGFGKTVEHNFTLLRQLQVFAMLNAPLLFGISRKSTIYKTLGITPKEALNGTTVLNTIGLMNGAKILRVHDIKEAAEAIRLFLAYEGAS